jgi:hypothetical protein
MSFPSDCPSCMKRDHSRHDARWGMRPGLIGGTHCVCKGECEQARVDLFANLRSLRAAVTPETTE